MVKGIDTSALNELLEGKSRAERRKIMSDIYDIPIRSLRRLEKIAEDAPDLFEPIGKGEMTISAAWKELRKRRGKISQIDELNRFMKVGKRFLKALEEMKALEEKKDVFVSEEELDEYVTLFVRIFWKMQEMMEGDDERVSD